MSIIGRNIQVGLAMEASRGVAEASPSKWMPKTSSVFKINVEKVMSENVQGILAESDDSKIVKKKIAGSINSDMDADMVGFFLANFFGSESVVDEGDSVYTHSFLIQESIEHASMTIFGKDGTIEQKKYNGCVVNSLTISMAQDNFVKVSADLLGKDETNDSSTPSFQCSKTFVGKNVTIKQSDTLIGLDSALAEDVKNMELTLEAGTLEDYKLGEYNPDLYNALSKITLAVTKNYTDTTYEDLYRTDNAKFVRIAIESSQDIGGANNPKLEFTLYKGKVMTWDRTDSANELVDENIEFNFYSNCDESDKQIECDLVNNIAEYITNPSV